MLRLSNNLVGIVNIITFIISIPILGGGIWLSKQANTECERFLEKPIIALGIFVMLISLAGLIGSCCRVSFFLWIYLVIMFLLIILIFCFTIFAFVVTNKGAGHVLSDRGYKEYRLGDYSNWLQKRVNNHWGKIESCLKDTKICKTLMDHNGDVDNKVEEFYKKHLSALQVFSFLLLAIFFIRCSIGYVKGDFFFRS